MRRLQRGYSPVSPLTLKQSNSTMSAMLKSLFWGLVSFLMAILLNPLTAVLLVLSGPEHAPQHPHWSCWQDQEDSAQVTVPLFNPQG